MKFTSHHMILGQRTDRVVRAHEFEHVLSVFCNVLEVNSHISRSADGHVILLTGPLSKFRRWIRHLSMAFPATCYNSRYPLPVFHALLLLPEKILNSAVKRLICH